MNEQKEVKSFKKIDELLKYAAAYGASDLHITANNPPIIRVYGELKKIPGPILTKEDTKEIIYSILNKDQIAALERKKEIDLSYTWGEVTEGVRVEYTSKDRIRARVNVFLDMNGIGAAFRIIPARIKTLEELPAPPIVAELVRKRRGLILVTGPTGCGKSTTLASMIDLIDREKALRIITIEDPIEYVFKGRNCLISQREIGVHSRSFASALRACLREDPDIILVGEMRDLETISLALTAAETGHLVLSTLHTNNVAETVDRVIDVFPADQQNFVRHIFANVIVGIISQILVPRREGGRAAAMEILVGTPAIKNLTRENKSYQIPSLVQTGTEFGMQTLDQSLIKLYQDGIITKDTLFEYCVDEKFVRSVLSGYRS